MPKLWYQKPASCFEEALPIGAGRFGAMLYGDPEEALLRLNEDSLWSGGPRSRINPDAQSGLAEVRELLSAGKIAQAETAAFQKLQGCPPDMRHYTPLGDLHVKLALPEGSVSDYLRELDLASAVSCVKFRVNGKQFTREVFASAPSQCIIMCFEGEIPFSAAISMSGREDDFERNCVDIIDDVPLLLFDGSSGGCAGIRFCAACRLYRMEKR